MGPVIVQITIVWSHMKPWQRCLENDSAADGDAASFNEKTHFEVTWTCYEAPPFWNQFLPFHAKLLFQTYFMCFFPFFPFVHTKTRKSFSFSLWWVAENCIFLFFGETQEEFMLKVVVPLWVFILDCACNYLIGLVIILFWSFLL